MSEWGKKNVGWVNEVTVRSMELLKGYAPDSHMEMISPAPLLMVVATQDTITQTDLALKAYQRALEPKELLLLPGGHFEGYKGKNLEVSMKKQVEFWEKHLCV
jgi:fermentation-respiration switch protein FrsA (DUF1100 family)